MVVSPTLKSSYTLHSIPDIHVGAVVGQLTVQLRMAGGNRVNEYYQPDTGGDVTIRGLNEFCADYFEGSIPNFLVSDDAYHHSVSKILYITLVDRNYVKEYAITILPSRVHLSYKPTYGFMTRCRNLVVCDDEEFYVPFYCNTLEFRIYAYDKTGSSSLIELSDSGSNSLLAYYTLTRSFIIEQTGELDSLAYCDIQLWYGSIQYDNIHVEFLDPLFSKTFFFDNALFAPQSFAFRGSEIQNPEQEVEYGYINGKYCRLSSRSHQVFTVTSGPLSEEELSTVRDILDADTVYIHQNGAFIPVVILSLEENTRIPANSPATVTMTYRLQGKEDVWLNADPHTDPRIFRDTFSKTFD